MKCSYLSCVSAFRPLGSVLSEEGPLVCLSSPILPLVIDRSGLEKLLTECDVEQAHLQGPALVPEQKSLWPASGC